MSKFVQGKWREIGKFSKLIEEFYGENAPIVLKSRPVTIHRLGSRHHSFKELLNKRYLVPKVNVLRYDLSNQHYYGLSDRDIERNVERMKNKKVLDEV